MIQRSIACGGAGLVVVLAAALAAGQTGTTITVNAGDNLQAALNRAVPGDTILLQAGATFQGNFEMPAKPAGGYITIRSSAPDHFLPTATERIAPQHSGFLPTITALPNGLPALRTAPGARRWRIVAVQFRGSPTTSDVVRLGLGTNAQNDLANVPSELILDRVIIRGEPNMPLKRGIALNSADTTIRNSYISDIKVNGQDAQAIAGWNGPGPFLIENNYLEAAGENILFGGADPFIDHLVPSDIVIRGNLLSKPLSWRGSSWTVKNLLELKNARRVLIEGNVLEHCWQASQNGFAVLFTPRNPSNVAPWTVVEQVTFRNNVVRRVAAGINILGYDDHATTQQTRGITIRNNLFQEIDHTRWGGNGTFLQLGDEPTDIIVDHNTIVQSGNAVTAYGGTPSSPRPIRGFRFTNNIALHNQYGIFGAGLGVGTPAIAQYFPGSEIVANVLAGGQSSQYPAGNLFPSVQELMAQFLNAVAGDYRLTPSSALQTAATDGGAVGVNFAALPILPAGVDSDGDGLPDSWEMQFGLNGSSSLGDEGPTGDPDRDGRTNLQEFQAGTHPKGTFVRYLAEGATGSFFDSRLSMANPNATKVKVLVRYLRQVGGPVSQFVPLDPFQRNTTDVGALTGLSASLFSIVVEADQPIGIDRTMRWGGGYGSHAETGVPAPSLTWYLAEGATGGAFNLFYLLQNPDLTTAADVRVRYLRENAGPLEKRYTVGPNGRLTIWVDEEQIPGTTGKPLARANLGAVLEVVSGPRIVVEWVMYMDTPGQLFGAGHDGAGVPAPATEWFLAEGATRDFFDLFVLMANPTADKATVDVDYLLPSGTVLTKTYQVPANQRVSIWVDQEEFPAGSGNKALARAEFSTRVRARDGRPIIVERAMWWPGPNPATWTEAHASAGSRVTGPRWVLGEGEVGGGEYTETFVLVANTSATPTTVKVTLLFESGLPVSKTYTLAANSRFTVWIRGEFPSAIGRRFGALVESVGATPAELVVERAMYSGHFAAGTNALGTKLP